MLKMAMVMIWICQSSHTNCVSQILREVGGEIKVST